MHTYLLRVVLLLRRHDAAVSSRRHDVAATISEKGMATLTSEWAKAHAALSAAAVRASDISTRLATSGSHRVNPM